MDHDATSQDDFEGETVVDLNKFKIPFTVTSSKIISLCSLVTDLSKILSGLCETRDQQEAPKGKGLWNH